MRQSLTTRWTIIQRVFFVLIITAAAPAAAQLKGDPERGAEKAKTCVACHGRTGRGPMSGVPALSGQQSEFITLQLILIREGLREIPEMTGMLKDFKDQDLVDIGAFFSRMEPFSPRGTRNDLRFAAGAKLSEIMGCGSCHMKGYVGQRQVPRIINQREEYLAKTLIAYRDNKRSGVDTSMNAVMYKTTDEDIYALAHYLAHQN
jgi:cytochrome c553